MSELFFTSDMHFGHKNIITHCNRPYSSVEEMDEALVKNWNDTVCPTDTVWHIGDWAFYNYHHIGQLNGQIHSVPGNHDHERINKLLPFLPNGFTDEVHYLKLDRGRRFVLCHYPFESWRREYRYHLHGHAHGTSTQRKFRLDVGTDVWRFKPIHIDTLMDEFLEQIND